MRKLFIMLMMVAVVSAGCRKQQPSDAVFGGGDGLAVSAQCRRGGCPEGMCLVPEGEAVMGALSSESQEAYQDCVAQWGKEKCNQDWFISASPQKTVTTGAFCMDRTEVTQSAYEQAAGRNPASFKACGGRCPVETVSWHEARAYCARRGLRLPTEAEWEKAARGGTETRFFWGDKFAAQYAWTRNNSSVKYSPSYDGLGTHPVATRKANGFGLQDMSGNVFEWVEDCYDFEWYEKMPAIDPANTPATCKRRVVRGGSWYDGPWDVRPAARHSYNPDFGDYLIGFRCASDAN